MTQFDLHTHSTASDGSLSPEALVARAKQQGVTHLALTDHDGTEGIRLAMAEAQLQDVVLIPGVEISVSWNGATVHIVGLQIDIDNEVLQQGLSALRDYRRQRAIDIATRLDKAGIHGAYEGASQYASETMLGRVHFARFLVEKGYAKDMKDVFKRFLVRNKPGYVTGHWASLEDTVNWITGAGGQAVIAHPARYKMTATKRRKLVAEFKALGGSGIEVASGAQHPEEVRTMARLATEFDLLASAGSDFHSPDNSYTELGKMTVLPPNVTPIWSTWVN
ncbi:MAG: PHP domain-containing protein [Pseudomonadota bacterium]|uniref:PHP domain-containing protein n=1 Tax=Methylophaga aminisulfidivorans TaxID=230105 RepID=UPI0024E24EA0|nr:PHP domain-containing protein [Methylophaga aminisulfidivorans]MEC9411120.1 PHP domain-containing protein [Pseudomonadota bacterium]